MMIQALDQVAVTNALRANRVHRLRTELQMGEIFIPYLSRQTKQVNSVCSGLTTKNTLGRAKKNLQLPGESRFPEV